MGWRDEVIRTLSSGFDLLVIGGGITGVGIVAVAARSGLRVLLVEKGDFASGTSSRSSKLVHGGLRYLKQLQFAVTYKSVRERQRLLRAAPGLVDPLRFFLPVYREDRTPAWLVEIGLNAYTRLAGDLGGYRRFSPSDALRECPVVRSTKLAAAFEYQDAQTDDARLVLRVLMDALRASGGRAKALSYARTVQVLRRGGRAVGVVIEDGITGQTHEVAARTVINATGAWANEVAGGTERHRRLRPLRGGHIFFAATRLPLSNAVAFSHPGDGRPVFACPWEGVVLVGTTDVDHAESLAVEPSVSRAEVDYLLEATSYMFPDLGLTFEDIRSTQAGIRPVLDTGKANPSDESRDHALWTENGLVTVTGGKLTTFRLVALAALREASRLDRRLASISGDVEILEPVTDIGTFDLLPIATRRRLAGRFGAGAQDIMTGSGHLDGVPGTPYLWSEVVWSAAHEAITHLSDLLLRRFRLGIVAPDGGRSLLSSLWPLFRELGWDRSRWDAEVAAFLGELERGHGLPRTEAHP